MHTKPFFSWSAFPVSTSVTLSTASYLKIIGMKDYVFNSQVLGKGRGVTKYDPFGEKDFHG